MSEERREERRVREGEVGGFVVRLSPLFLERFFQSLTVHNASAIEYDTETLRMLSRVQETPDIAGYITQSILNNITSTGAGRIVHPVYGWTITWNRVLQASASIYSVTLKLIDQLIEDATSPYATPEKIQSEIDTVLMLSDASAIALMEVMNRLVTLQHINAPAPARPPLVNAQEGFEIF